MIELISDIIKITPEDNISDGKGGYIPSIQDKPKTKVQYETFYESWALGLKISSLLKRNFNNCSIQINPEIKNVEISINTTPIIDITYTENLFIPLEFNFPSRTNALTNAVTFLGQLLVTNSSDIEIIEDFENKVFSIYVSGNELVKVKYKLTTQLGAKAAKRAILLGLSPYLSQNKQERAISLAGNYIQYYYRETKLPKNIKWIDIYGTKEQCIKISVKIALNETNFSPGSTPINGIKKLVEEAKSVQRIQPEAFKSKKKKTSLIDRIAGSRFDHDD